jgi:hypothetical protein
MEYWQFVIAHKERSRHHICGSRKLQSYRFLGVYPVFPDKKEVETFVWLNVPIFEERCI